MTRDEIMQTLLSGNALHIDSQGEVTIALSTSRARRLAEIIFSQLQSESVETLKTNEKFFELLDAADAEDRDPSENYKSTPTSIASNTQQDVWRLTKIQTWGFGGLNTHSDMPFTFEVKGKSWLIEGQNGSGKSSLANAILFALTGKIYRDQIGLIDNPAAPKPVYGGNGEERLGEWPQVAVYPETWDNADIEVSVCVELTFKNSVSGKIAKAARSIKGSDESYNIDSQLAFHPLLIEAGLLMPMRLHHIRISDSGDNNTLVDLVVKLIGFDALLEAASLTDALCHGAGRFLKNNVSELTQTLSNHIREMNQEIDSFEQQLEMDKPKINADGETLINKDMLDEIDVLKQYLEETQAEGFKALSEFTPDTFDPNDARERNRIALAITELSINAQNAKSGEGIPEILLHLKDAAASAADGKIAGLADAIACAKGRLSEADEWHERQDNDVRFRLKAVASEHFDETADNPECPLCESALTTPEQKNLAVELAELKKDADKAQAKLDDVCRTLEGEISAAAERALPRSLVNCREISVKNLVIEDLKEKFVKLQSVPEALPKFGAAAERKIKDAFADVPYFEFGKTLSSDKSSPRDKLIGLIEHLESVITATEKRPDRREKYGHAWKHLFKSGDTQSLTGQISAAKSAIDKVVPYKRASQIIEKVLAGAPEYNAAVKKKNLREDIKTEIEPLRKLRPLVVRLSNEMVSELSDRAKQIHKKIHNPEALIFRDIRVISERNRQSVLLCATPGEKSSGDNPADWKIDATLLGNTSWIKGILWSFLFALREKAVSSHGASFPLMVLDDPQLTFDTRNLRAWGDFLQIFDSQSLEAGTQMLVTTHNRDFASLTWLGGGFECAKIECGLASTGPAQIIDGNFADIRFAEMEQSQSDEDDKARILIGDIRTLAEVMLKHSLRGFQPSVYDGKNCGLGTILGRIKQGIQSQESPYTDKVFGDLQGVVSSRPELVKFLNTPHHTISETITVHQGQQVYEFWKCKLFPAIQKVWSEYRFTQTLVSGEQAAIQLPTNCNHKPVPSKHLRSVTPKTIGAVAAMSEGRVSFTTAGIENGEMPASLSGLAAYRLEQDTLSPVAQIGDILLVNLNQQINNGNLVIEDRGDSGNNGEILLARRLSFPASAEHLAVLNASSSNPKNIPAAVISRKKGANRYKITGVIYAAGCLTAGTGNVSGNEATPVPDDGQTIAKFLKDIQLVRVNGESAEPLALNRQKLFVKPPRQDLRQACRNLDGKPVIAENTDGEAFFKRLRFIDQDTLVLESLDKAGQQGVLVMSIREEDTGDNRIRSVREVVGVLFDETG